MIPSALIIGMQRGFLARRPNVNGLPEGAPIISKSCSLCELCVQVCEAGALAREDDHVALVHPEDCGGCGMCEEICPEHAIECCFEIVWDDRHGAR